MRYEVGGPTMRRRQLREHGMTKTTTWSALLSTEEKTEDERDQKEEVQCLFNAKPCYYNHEISV